MDQNRKMEIQMIRRELLKLNPVTRLREINDMYFNGKLSDEEYDEMRDWYFGIIRL